MATTDLEATPKISKSRSTFNLENKNELIKELSKLLSKIGTLTLITYRDESEKPEHSKLFIEDIAKNIDLLVILHEAQPNLSFSKGKVNTILQGVAKESRIKFKDQEENDDWVTTNCRRWQNMTRNIRCSISNGPRSKIPQWAIQTLPWLKGIEQAEIAEDAGAEIKEELAEIKEELAKLQKSGSDNPRGSGSGESLTTADEEVAEDLDDDELEQVIDGKTSKFEIKFSTELMLPMRREIPASKSQKVRAWEPGSIEKYMGIWPKEVIDMLADEKVIARWPDGYRIKMEQTRRWLSNLQRESKSRSKIVDILFEQEATATRHSISISQRTDRTLLLSIYEQGKQICQVQLDKFGPVEPLIAGSNHLPKDHDTVLRAMTIMKPLAIMYARGEIKKEELKSVKDDRVKDWIAKNGIRGASCGSGPKKPIEPEQDPSELADNLSKTLSQRESTKRPLDKEDPAASSAIKRDPARWFEPTSKAAPKTKTEPKSKAAKMEPKIETNSQIDESPEPELATSCASLVGPPIKDTLEMMEDHDDGDLWGAL